jgi:hypothetical protein
MISNNHAFTATGKIKRPSYSTVATWVKDSWDGVSIDLIKKSFKCCGVSTKLDGSEDHLLFDFDKILDPDEEIEDPNNQESNEEYPEESDYKNDWNIGSDTNDEIDKEVGDKDDEVDNEVDDKDDKDDRSAVDNRRKEKRQDKGKGKEEDNKKENEYQEGNIDIYSSDDEELCEELEQKLNEFKKKCKRKIY